MKSGDFPIEIRRMETVRVVEDENEDGVFHGTLRSVKLGIEITATGYDSINLAFEAIVKELSSRGYEVFEQVGTWDPDDHVNQDQLKPT